MKKITLSKLLFILFCIPTFLIAQQKTTQEFSKCLADEYNAELLENNPNMMGSEIFKQQLDAKIEELKNSPQRRVVIEIPLVVHVLHNGEPIGTGANISDAQVMSQVTVMNEDFRMIMGTPGESSQGGVDVEVEFVMAQRTPDGCPTNGINRVNICQDGTNSADVNFWKTQTIWSRVSYMNMWSSKYVGDLAGILGFAQFPGGNASTDGVSAGHTYFGSSDYDDGTFNTSPPYDKGRTMTHEVGHYLGLYHTFQGGCAGAGDEVADTPPVASPNFGCPPNNISCGDRDMVENYMDYSDDLCMDTFTQGQKDRVLAVLATSRLGLTTSNGATPLPSVSDDSSVAIESPNISCGTEVNPIIVVTNWGTSTLTSATISYDIDGGASTDYNWSGSLATGESETVTLSGITSTAGNHDLNVSINSTNDVRACNNDASVCFTLAATSGACASIGNATDTYLTSTTGLTFNTIDNLNNNPGGDVGYSDFTNLATDVNRESSYELNVYVNTDGNYFVRTFVWIDWNQNCSLDDAGEEYDLGETQNVNNELSSGSPISITIPTDAVLGNTIMRVTTKWAGNAGGVTPSACENDHDAEVEDYTLNVLGSLSVDEYAFNNIRIYPNPTNSVLNISLSDNNLPDSYRIYNMLGQTVATKQISSNADLGINSSGLSNGMYFVKINKGDSSVTLPFIKE